MLEFVEQSVSLGDRGFEVRYDPHHDDLFDHVGVQRAEVELHVGVRTQRRRDLLHHHAPTMRVGLAEVVAAQLDVSLRLAVQVVHDQHAHEDGAQEVSEHGGVVARLDVDHAQSVPTREANLGAFPLVIVIDGRRFPRREDVILVFVVVEEHGEKLDFMIRSVDTFDLIIHAAVPIDRQENDERVGGEHHDDLEAHMDDPKVDHSIVPRRAEDVIFVPFPEFERPTKVLGRLLQQSFRYFGIDFDRPHVTLRRQVLESVPGRSVKEEPRRRTDGRKNVEKPGPTDLREGQIAGLVE
mmetsp:Transcript_24049/g.65074  ORF Transcript_24049/g.65074 Transcript_24049/m.65074 type:complete len:296 (-) Transcript_24049:464-1351(-)